MTGHECGECLLGFFDLLSGRGEGRLRWNKAVLANENETDLCNHPLDGSRHHAKGETERDPDVRAMGAVKLLRQRPRNSGTVQTLRVLTTAEVCERLRGRCKWCVNVPPNIRTHGVKQDLTLGIDDRDHDSIVNYCAKDRAPDLSEEHGAWRDFEVLAHLEVGCQVDRR